MTLYLGNQIVANSVTVPYNWSGTKAEYEALETINPEWVYYITDDSDITLTLLETIYPVGSLYITTNNTCPLSALFGTWQLVAQDRVLQGAGSRGSVGTTVDESLPNTTGDFIVASAVKSNVDTTTNIAKSGVFKYSYGSSLKTGDTNTTGATYFCESNIVFNANGSSSTYQDDAPVQPDAYLVNIYRRTA